MVEAQPNHATMQNVAFTRWDPLRDLLALHEQIGQLVGTDAPGWTPPVDLYETAGELRPDRGSCPACTRDSIDIHAEESRIVIRGERAHAARCRASSFTASSADTAASRAPSCCPNRSTSTASPPI